MPLWMSAQCCPFMEARWHHRWSKGNNCESLTWPLSSVSILGMLSAIVGVVEWRQCAFAKLAVFNSFQLSFYDLWELVWKSKMLPFKLRGFGRMTQHWSLNAWSGFCAWIPDDSIEPHFKSKLNTPTIDATHSTLEFISRPSTSSHKRLVSKSAEDSVCCSFRAPIRISFQFLRFRRSKIIRAVV